MRRYLCQACRRTVSLLPEFVLPYLRSSLMVIAMFLIARLLCGQTIEGAAQAAPQSMPYQRGQFWIRRFRAQAAALCAALAALTQPAPAPDFVHRALTMLEASGWIAAHRFLFAGVRCHLLGWPRWRRCPAANSHAVLRNSPPASTIFPIPPAVRSRWTPCWTGRCVIAAMD